MRTACSGVTYSDVVVRDQGILGAADQEIKLDLEEASYVEFKHENLGEKILSSPTNVGPLHDTSSL